MNVTIVLSLSDKNIEIIESILKNSDYSYDFFVNNKKIESSILIIDYLYMENSKFLSLKDFKKVICILPNGYINFISDNFKLKNISFIELPITYSKLIAELQ